jgi:hypothetical protein
MVVISVTCGLNKEPKNLEVLLRGKVIESSKRYYIVDLSKHVKKLGINQDMSRFSMLKKDCEVTRGH